jgi:hypothetical protein
MADEPITVDISTEVGLTPLAQFAAICHEMFTAFQEAGFSKQYAFRLVRDQIPEWTFPVVYEDDEDEEEEYEMHTEEEDDDSDS